ncbi:SGNH hydrolase [Lophiostoma macrostomum CBS 122681]|uniref:SGNH hydrolase n=1 Tax=Lophiostoma macrostomum CBS 122681 TaxID=1314788 RepID=A0A6A6T3C9_9PLEO|nr:SGNH hydrolase [Lophiostoma macrostomum CBS 122681]
MLQLAFLLVAPAAVASGVVPRDEWSDKVDAWASEKHPPQAIIDAVKRKPEGDLTLQSYSQPNEYVKVILSPGDSYTAGIGTRGTTDKYGDSKDCSRYAYAWPERLRDHPGWDELQGSGWRKNNFGACSGAKMQEIRTLQLELGDSNDGDQYKKIGQGDLAPQIAVLTASGNDVGFSTIVLQCIYAVPWGDLTCDQALAQAEYTIITKKDDFKNQLQQLWGDIIVAGRIAKGAHPPESFQVYQGTYINFFNEGDPTCDKISWNQFKHKNNLDGILRGRLNKLVQTLNNLIREAADEVKDYGVFYVDAYQNAFDGHRFCDPTGMSPQYDIVYHDYVNEDKGSQTWFWGLSSPDDGTDGPDHPINGNSNNISQAILDQFIPNKTQQAQISEQNPPENINPALKDEKLFLQGISNITLQDGDVKTNLGDAWNRVFHPKAKAQEAIRDGFFDTIKAQRKWDFHQQGPQQPQQPYKPGTCSFHIEHIERCPPERITSTNKGLFGLIDLKDADGKTLELKDANGFVITPTDLVQLFDLDSHTDTVHLKSVLPVELWIDPGHASTLNFFYGSQDWDSDIDNDPSKVPYCTGKDWNPDFTNTGIESTNAYCATRKEGDEVRRRHLDCFFKCD